MRKFVKTTSIVAVCLLGAGLLLTGTGIAWSLRVADRLTPEQGIEQELKVEVDDLHSLDISQGVSSLCFVPVDSAQEARVESSGFEEGELTLEQKDGKLTVKSRGSLVGGPSIINFNLFRIDWLGRLHIGSLEQRSITLYLPRDLELDEILLSQGVGEASGELPVHAQSLQLNMGVGSLSLSGLSADSLSVSGGAGELLLSDFSCDTLDLSGGVGSIALQRGTVSQRASLDSGVGEIVIDGGVWHNLTLVGGTGEMSFNGALYGSCHLEGGMGSISISLDDPADLYSVSIDKGLGDVNVVNGQLIVLSDGDNRYSVIPSGETGNTIGIEMGVGEVLLSFAP